jgi:hypothetical protein
MTEQVTEKGGVLRPLNKALWMQALDQLEREFVLYRQRSSPPFSGVAQDASHCWWLRILDKTLSVLGRESNTTEAAELEPST